MTVKTAEKPRAAEQQAQADRRAGTEVAIAAPRLPYHPSIEERFGVDRSTWRALCDAVFPAAKTTEAIILALSYCKARNLDPFKRMVHIVPIWSSEKNDTIESVWPGIAEHRATAFRTGQYAGCDPTSFGPVKVFEFSGRVKVKGGGFKDETAEVEVPEWAQITVYRMIGGQRCAFPGPRCYFLAGYARKSKWVDLPNERWQQGPSYMLEKQAEAAALRKAFPEELGDYETAEEMERHTVDVTPERDIPETPAPLPPTRAQFRDVPEHDPETGEIIEAEPVNGATDQQPDPALIAAANLEADITSRYMDATSIAALDKIRRDTEAAVAELPDQFRSNLARVYQGRVAALQKPKAGGDDMLAAEARG